VGLVVSAPDPWLRAHARRYYGFREDTGGPRRRREGPGVDVVVLLSLDHEWRIGSATDPAERLARHTSFVAGLRDSAVLTEHGGRSHAMQISLTPPGAYALLGLPMSELAGEIVHADDVLGRRAPHLVERLAQLPTWAQRFELLDTTLASLLDGAPRPSPEVVWAWRRLHVTAGRVRIGELTRELGWSRKRLASRFRTEIGMTPKALARLLRFERATALLLRAERPPLGEIAFACGYYDQAHLTHEIRRIAGVTPAAYAPNFQDTASSAS
jgi:AraC-like DNA-binding protein